MTKTRPTLRARRVRRLLPLAALLLAVCGVATAVVLDPGGHSFADGAPTVVAHPSARPTTTPHSPTASPSNPSKATKLQILGLGDSVTAGTNCNCTDFITALGSRLADVDDVAVDSVNKGANGATAADLDDDLGDDPALQRSVTDSDIIVITIGANDLTGDLSSYQDGGCDASCFNPDVAQMGAHLASAVKQIHQLRGSAPTTVVLTTYWNLFPDGDVGAQNGDSHYPAWSDQITRAANAAICNVASAHQASCVDLYTPFKHSDGSGDPTDLLADDGDHPNAVGEERITGTLLAELTRQGGQATPQ